jgi:hypothetical protein
MRYLARGLCVVGVLTLTGFNCTGSSDTPAVVIYTHPQSVAVMDGDNATFEVEAAGRAPLSWQWQRNGEAVPGATQARYTTTLSMADDGAAYRVKVSDSFGESLTSNAAIATVRPRPVSFVSALPSTVSAAAGATVTLRPELGYATPPLTYQWRRNGVDIAGATEAAHTTPALTPGDNGAQFQVVVGNPVGTVASNVVTLFVN